MGCIDYTDAVNGALERLHSTGFYIGDSFANHAPMAAEALAKLGYYGRDELPLVRVWLLSGIGSIESDSCLNVANNR